MFKRVQFHAALATLAIAFSQAQAQSIDKQSNVGTEWQVFYEEPLPNDTATKWKISKIRVIIPRNVKASTANILAPNAEIVWHEGPSGSPKSDVAELLVEVGKRLAQKTSGKEKVVLEIEVAEFHGTTPVAKRKLKRSGVHNISLLVSFVDESSSRILVDPTAIYADLEAYTGERLSRNTANGINERNRVLDHLVTVLSAWIGDGTDPRRNIERLGR